MNLISNVDLNWGIGKDGKLLVHIPEDMKYFKGLTLNKIIVMGRNTFNSLPNQSPLIDRLNIILTSDTKFHHPTIKTFNTLENLKNHLGQFNNSDIFIIGGESIYNIFFNYCSTAYITQIYHSFSPDRFMINLDIEPNWKLFSSSQLKEYKGIYYKFNIYKNSCVLNLNNHNEISQK